ncbi:MAG TPA: twin-arginine translocation signal domain-containing protein, partial [Porticoccaceae bacterium]|nr:twin-arginine translocation signal domain-containing protein [Porticoccaceae bacterium]
MSQTNSRSRRNFLKGAAVVGGAASLGACTSSPSSVNSSPSAIARYES